MAFDYAGTIFAGAELGDVWLADSGDNYQESSRTTLAGDGDPVGSATGQGGNHNAQQATSDSRPTLTQDAGGKWYFSFDGTDDHLVAGAASNWVFLHNSGDCYVCGAIRASAHTSNKAIFGTFAGSDTNIGILFVMDNRTAIGFTSAVNLQIGKGASPMASYGVHQAVLPTTEDHVFEVIKSTTGGVTTVQCYIDGIAVGGDQVVSPSASNPQTELYVGQLFGGLNRWIGRIYGLLVTDTIPSATNRGKIRTDMSQRMVTPSLKINGGYTASVTLTLKDPNSSGAAWASKTGLAVDVSVDRDSAPFYSATSQSTNGSGEITISATNCPLNTGTQTVWICITDSDGTAGSSSNDSVAFYAPVSVTVA